MHFGHVGAVEKGQASGLPFNLHVGMEKDTPPACAFSTLPPSIPVKVGCYLRSPVLSTVTTDVREQCLHLCREDAPGFANQAHSYALVETAVLVNLIRPLGVVVSFSLTFDITFCHLHPSKLTLVTIAEYIETRYCLTHSGSL